MILAIQPSAKDNIPYLGAPDTNYGDRTHLQVFNYEGDTVRSILEFDLSAIPAGQTIISASLSLYYYDSTEDDPVGKTAWVYKLARTDWVEDEATWNSYKTGSAWTAAGGDYVTTDPAGGSTTFPAAYGWMAWDVLAIVKDAYAAENPAEFLIKHALEGLDAGPSNVYFYSNNYTDALALRPKLVIEYEPVFAGQSMGAGIRRLEVLLEEDKGS